ncbi:hypothetical protein [Pseudodesulfovibrio profundus]|jgi:hypothetical protein|nr:hypothetical protein [Pseudodesulfovibrio profundus]
MGKNTNEITDRGRKWLDTLEQDSEGRYVVQEDYARKCTRRRVICSG